MVKILDITGVPTKLVTKNWPLKMIVYDRASMFAYMLLPTTFTLFFSENMTAF